jgi:hypothetical protein
MIVETIAVIASVVTDIGYVKFDFVWKMDSHPFN